MRNSQEGEPKITGLGLEIGAPTPPKFQSTEALNPPASEYCSLDANISFWSFAATCAARSMPLALLRGSPCILNLFCLFWTGYFQDRTMTAAIGLSMCCYMFFNNVLVLINGDCVGVWCSKYFA